MVGSAPRNAEHRCSQAAPLFLLLLLLLVLGAPWCEPAASTRLQARSTAAASNALDRVGALPPPIATAVGAKTVASLSLSTVAAHFLATALATPVDAAARVVCDAAAAGSAAAALLLPLSGIRRSSSAARAWSAEASSSRACAAAS
jgi:hypothetical protein